MGVWVNMAPVNSPSASAGGVWCAPLNGTGQSSHCTFLVHVMITQPVPMFVDKTRRYSRCVPSSRTIEVTTGVPSTCTLPTSDSHRGCRRATLPRGSGEMRPACRRRRRSSNSNHSPTAPAYAAAPDNLPRIGRRRSSSCTDRLLEADWLLADALSPAGTEWHGAAAAWGRPHVQRSRVGSTTAVAARQHASAGLDQYSASAADRGAEE